jgi:hypothetical protein
MEEYVGRRASGKKRLANLRTRLTTAANDYGFGRTTLSGVSDIEGWSIYLARHIDQSRLKVDRKLKRVSYSADFKRVCMPTFSWTSPFASRWRNAVAQIAESYGYKATDSSRKWMWHHYREILECADEMTLPKRDFDAMPRTVVWEGRVWTVLRFEEEPNLFVLQRSTEGSERFMVCDPSGKHGAVYSTMSEYVSRRELQRIINAGHSLVA